MRKKKLITKAKYGLLGVLLIAIFIIINRKIFFTLVFTLIGSYIKFIRVKYRMPISFEPVYFLSVLLTRQYGLLYGLSLVIVSAVFIDLIAGDISVNTIISITVNSILNVLALLLGQTHILVFGLITSILNMIASIIMGIILGGVPPDRLILMPITNFFFNISYFMTLGEILEKVMI